MPANSPDLSPLWQVLRHHLALVSPALFLTCQNTVGPGKTEMKQKKIFFRDLSFFLLPSSHHQALPTARCHCSGGESSFLDIHDSCSSFYHPIPRPSPFFSADFILDGDVIGMKIGRANASHSFCVTLSPKPGSWRVSFNYYLINYIQIFIPILFLKRWKLSEARATQWLPGTPEFELTP